MPNNCTNQLSCISGKTIGSIIKPYLTDDGKSIDFNKILPMPEGILKTLGSSTIEEITKKRTPEEEEARQKETDLLEEQNQKDYGHKNWYEWCFANWDTKWNAYSCWTLEDGFNEIDDLSDITFQTAWSPPIQIVKELAKLTGETLRLSYYDEGWMFGGVCIAKPDGSGQDNCYENIDDCPDHLKEELDVQFYLDGQKENEDEDDKDDE
jgi:hypothetical protein